MNDAAEASLDFKASDGVDAARLAKAMTHAVGSQLVASFDLTRSGEFHDSVFLILRFVMLWIDKNRSRWRCRGCHHHNGSKNVNDVISVSYYVKFVEITNCVLYDRRSYYCT